MEKEHCNEANCTCPKKVRLSKTCFYLYLNQKGRDFNVKNKEI